MDAVPSPAPSPMIAAYAEACAAAPGYLVLYRVGEFYEILHQAAATAPSTCRTEVAIARDQDSVVVIMPKRRRQ